MSRIRHQGAKMSKRDAASRMSAAAGALSRRHCERSEAIQRLSAEGFWIASLRSQ
jgi:hypothetical protein